MLHAVKGPGISQGVMMNIFMLWPRSKARSYEFQEEPNYDNAPLNLNKKRNREVPSWRNESQWQVFQTPLLTILQISLYMYVYISSIKILIKIPLETESSKFSITASQSTSQPSLQGSKKGKTNLQKQSRHEIETTYAIC